ncbi:carboxylesterase [Christiangramia fulva]|uniref:Carboxylesterase n=2 Tax=Christiangramia fulva TaxID=2126553 RepID=A0A2R3ZAT9_9FLAO|nr:carboxylesterase [Christiangramia fulva]
MKSKLSVFLFLLPLQMLLAQEVYVDSLYKVKEPITKTYAEKDGEKLIVDLYQPENSEKKRPTIVFMHGGGFSGGSPKNPQEVRFTKTAAAKGYNVALISYRLTRKNKSFGCDFAAEGKIKTFQMAAEDYMDAVKYLIDHASEFSIDENKIIAGGSSAGAEAVLNAIYNPQLMFGTENPYKDIQFSAVISLAGAIVDVRYLNKEQAIPGLFFHGTADQLVPYATAPHHYCEPSEPGYIILDGAETITEKLQKLNTSYLFFSFDGAGHEISGMPFQYFPQLFGFLKNVVFQNMKIQETVYE